MKETRAEFLRSGKGDATCRSVFLLQRRTIVVSTASGRWDWCPDCEGWADTTEGREEGCQTCGSAESLSDLCVLRAEAAEPDADPSRLPEWTENTRSFWEPWAPYAVWSNRADAEDYGKRHAYNAGEGWRVYCVPCSEEMEEILARGREKPAIKIKIVGSDRLLSRDVHISPQSYPTSNACTCVPPYLSLACPRHGARA